MSGKKYPPMAYDNNVALPIDIKEIYDDKYMTYLDESAYHEDGGKRNPWYFRIKCSRGHIYAYSSDRLGYSGEGTRLKTALSKIPNVVALQDGDSEFAISFPPSALTAIAKYVRPIRRRRLSPEERQRRATTMNRNRKNTNKNRG